MAKIHLNGTSKVRRAKPNLRAIQLVPVYLQTRQPPAVYGEALLSQMGRYASPTAIKLDTYHRGAIGELRAKGLPADAAIAGLLSRDPTGPRLLLIG